MRRDAQIRTQEGQAAWQFYQLWLKKNRRSTRGIHSFVGSRYYKAFNKFAEFVKKLSLPEPDTFIWFVVDKKYEPTLWTDRRVYQEYLEFLDRQGDYLSRAACTIKTIKKIASEVGCEFAEVFDHITAPELIHKINSRELSPWLLLASPKFINFYKTEISPTDRVRIEGIIRIPYWKERFAKYPDAHKDMKSMVKRLNL